MDFGSNKREIQALLKRYERERDHQEYKKL